MKYRKITAMMTAAVMSLSMISFKALAADVNFRYENTYDNGVDDVVDVDNEFFTLTNSGPNKLNQKAVKDGNVGVTTGEAAWAAQRSVLFELKNGGINTGIVRVAFDISMRMNKASHSGDNLIVGINMKESWDGGRLVYLWSGKDDTKPSVGMGGSIGGWPSGNGAFQMEPNKVYTMEFIMDYNKGTVRMYANGEMLDQVYTNLKSYKMTNFSIAYSGMSDYFDNLVFEHMDSMDMTSELKSVENNAVVMQYSDGIDTETVPTGDIIVKNLFTGEEIVCHAETSDAVRELRIVSEENFEKGCEYSMEIPAGIAGYSASASEAKKVIFNTGNGRYLKSLRVSGVGSDEEHALTTENPSETNKIILTYSDGLPAQVVTDIKITDADGTEVAYTPEYTGSKAVLNLDGTLLENSSYTLEIPKCDAIEREYSIEFKTGEGKILTTKTTYYNGENEISSLESVAEGDVISVKKTFVSTYKDEKSALVSASLWNKLVMNGYDFATITLNADGGRKAEAELSFTVKNAEDLKLKTFLWQGLGKINPLTSETTLN